MPPTTRRISIVAAAARLAITDCAILMAACLAFFLSHPCNPWLMIFVARVIPSLMAHTISSDRRIMVHITEPAMKP
jgi:hypothetical protein